MIVVWNQYGFSPLLLKSISNVKYAQLCSSCAYFGWLKQSLVKRDDLICLPSFEELKWQKKISTFFYYYYFYYFYYCYFYHYNLLLYYFVKNRTGSSYVIVVVFIIFIFAFIIIIVVIIIIIINQWVTCETIK